MHQVQNKPDSPTNHIHQAAIFGVQGRGATLPHLSKIQTAFGRHDLSDVRAHMDSSAQQVNHAIGAKAYTLGSNIAFNSTTPDLHTTAHEAAHVIQQYGGIHLTGGIGKVGDPYERHADAVADLVVHGKSAEGLLNSFNSQADLNAKIAISPSQSISMETPMVQMLGGYIPGNPNLYEHWQMNGNLSTAKARFTPVQRQQLFAENLLQMQNRYQQQLAQINTNVFDEINFTPLTTNRQEVAEIDHIYPRSRGGMNSYYNAQVISAHDNGALGNRYPRQGFKNQVRYQGTRVYMGHQTTANIPLGGQIHQIMIPFGTIFNVKGKGNAATIDMANYLNNAEFDSVTIADAKNWNILPQNIPDPYD